MNVKLAAVVLALIVVLFVVALAVGGSQDEGSPTDRNSVIDRLGDAAGDPAALPLENLSAGCVSEDDPTLLLFDGGCTIVAQNDDDLRVLRLQTDSPIEVEAPAPEGDTDVEAEFDPGEEATVAIGEGEIEVELSCGAGFGGGCSVRIVE
jgi:hypothetical protein